MSTFFKHMDALPEELQAALLTLRSQPAHFSNAVQTIMRPVEDAGALNQMLSNIVSIDRTTADLQFAESYLLEGIEFLEANNYVDALTLFEMGNRLCQRAAAQSPDPDLATAGVQWGAECLANMGAVCLNVEEHSKARGYLEAAHAQFRSTGNWDHAAHCQDLLDNKVDSWQADLSESKDLGKWSRQELIAAAEDALCSLRLLEFLDLSPRAVCLLDDLPLDDRIAEASALLSTSYLPERRAASVVHLQKIYEAYPEIAVLREAKYLWLYFARMRCYGVMSNPTLLYFITSLATTWSLSISNLQERSIFRESFSSQYEEALKWALTQRRFMLALHLADQQKSRSTFDLLLARREAAAAGAPEVDAATRLLVPSSKDAIARLEKKPDQSRPEALLKHWVTIGRLESRVRGYSGEGLIDPAEEISTYVSVNAARRLAPFEALILEYALIEDMLHVFAAPATRFTDTQGAVEHYLTKIGVPEMNRLGAACRRIREVGQRFGDRDRAAAEQESVDAGRELYELIIGNMQQGWNEPHPSMSLEQRIAQHHRLLIVPTGPLASIPWFALRSKDAWFWQQNLLSIVPSLSLLWAATYLARPMGRDISNILLVGNPTNDLPATVKECEAIQEIIRVEEGAATKLLVGAQATLENVRTRMPNCDVLHFACHGTYVEGNPAESFLALSDGRLTAQDLASADLEDKAVVLSCCESGVGEAGWSDDVFALAHACLIGGARYVVASLWPVEDESTSLIMQTFYKHLVAGYSPHLSLNLAINTLANHPDFSLPRFWAPFQLFGSPEDVDAKAIIQQTLGALSDFPDVDEVFIAEPLLHENRVMMDLNPKS